MTDEDQDETYDTLIAMRRNFVQQLRVGTFDLLTTLDADDVNIVAQAWFEAMAHELGYLSGVLHLAGIPQDEREASLREGILNGKIEAHDRAVAATPDARAALLAEIRVN